MAASITVEHLGIEVGEVEREITGPAGDQARIRVHFTISTPDDASDTPRRVPPVELRDGQGRNYPPIGAQGMDQAPAPRYRAEASATFVLAKSAGDLSLIFAPGTAEEKIVPLDAPEAGLRWERGEQPD